MLLLALSFVVFCLIGVPVAFSIGLASLVYIINFDTFPLSTIVQRMTLATESWPLMAVPFFVLLGQLIVVGDVGSRLLHFFDSLVGHIRGGLAHVSIVGSMFFAGVSGSAVADAAGIGSVLIPEMNNKGYHCPFSVAINATSSTIGVIIPPSIPLIVFGWMTNISIQRLFLGGVIPGILIGLTLIVIAWVISKKRNYPKGKRASLMDILRLLKENFFILLTPVLVLGSIMFGIMSSTESALIGVVYILVIQMFYYKTFGFKELFKILCDTARTTGVVIYVISTSMVLSHILTYEDIPRTISNIILSLTDNRYLIILGMNIVLLFMGTVLDLVPSMMIFTPIFYPVALQLGMNPIQFGVMMTINLAIGLFTPPVGQTLYISSLIGKISIEEGAKACIPFFVAMLLVLAAVALFPSLTVWLPSIIGM